jgi:adenosylhomocysteine nucleosidase
MKTIGLIAAMPQEVAALLKYVNGRKRIGLGPFSIDCFELSGQNYILVTSGMGIQRASEAARELIEKYTPLLLISFGIAGAVEADLEIGDVVAVEAAYRLDLGVLSPRLLLNHWPEAAREETSRILARRGAHLFPGTTVTTRGVQVIENQFKGMVHAVLEMETAGIAQLAAEKGIPLFSLRAISDGPRAPIPFDLGEIMDDDANLRIGRILMAMVRHPGIVFKIKGLMRNTRIAADNAAIALIAVLSKITI